MGFPEMEREKTSQPIQPEKGKEVPAVSAHVTSSLATGENWGMMGKTTSDDNGISRHEELSTRSWQDTVRSPRQTGCQRAAGTAVLISPSCATVCSEQHSVRCIDSI